MPRKRRLTRVSTYEIREIDPSVPVPAEDHDLVRFALVDFDEVAVLPEPVREQLVADLVEAVRYTRCGVKAGKRGMSDQALAQQIFLSDVQRAMGSAGLPATRWRKRYDDGDRPSDDAPESLFFRLAREVAEVCGISLPQDLKLAGQRASRHQYGIMSPTMKAAQDEELDAQPQPPEPDGA
jgi:hypothetical protein